MYINNKQLKAFKFVGAIFTILGILFVIIAVVLGISNSKFFCSAIKSNAVIDSIYSYQEYDDLDDRWETRYDVYVSYTTDDGEYISGVDIGYYTSGMREGKKVTIYYNPDDPYDVRSRGGSTLGVALFGFVGVLFTVVGIILLVKVSKKRLNGGINDVYSGNI